MSKNIFITGTGTDVGKTFISALLVKKLKEYGLDAAYYKAAMSGNDRDTEGNLIPGDANYVKRVSGIQQDVSEMCPYIYEAAYSPHLASRIEGNPVKWDVVKKGYETVCGKHDFVTMEGSGGIFCPIDIDHEELWLWEMIQKLNLSCILVADAGLGTINDVALSAYYMKEKEIPVVGMIFNHFHPGNVMEEDNIRMCEAITGLKTIACVEEEAEDLSISKEDLIALYQ